MYTVLRNTHVVFLENSEIGTTLSVVHPYCLGLPDRLHNVKLMDCQWHTMPFYFNDEDVDVT